MTEIELIRRALAHYADHLLKESTSKRWAGAGYIPYRAELRSKAADVQELARKDFLVRDPGSVIRQEGMRVLITACGHSFVTCHTDKCFKKEK